MAVDMASCVASRRARGDWTHAIAVWPAAVRVTAGRMPLLCGQLPCVSPLDACHCCVASCHARGDWTHATAQHK
jgi:hypothetical protein